MQDGLPGGPVIIHGAHKCDVDGEADRFWVVFEGDRISAVGEGAGWAAYAGGGADVVDAAGAVLTPGFIDLHCHGGGGFSFDAAGSDSGAPDRVTSDQGTSNQRISDQWTSNQWTSDQWTSDRGTSDQGAPGRAATDRAAAVPAAPDLTAPDLTASHREASHHAASVHGGTDAVGRALAVHRTHGTTRSVLSLVANPVGVLERSLAAIADIAERDPLVLGSHLEGPFLAPGRRGAHNPDFLITPSPPLIERLMAAARGTLRQVTIAPELPGALDVVPVLTEAGVIVAVGHTEADEEQAQAAFDRGARLLTHAFNAMPGIGHRNPGPVVAAIGDERVTAELVLDGVHVHPDVARLLLNAAEGRVALITDAMAAAGSADGHYKLGSLDVDVVDGVARLTGPDGVPGSIAGSTLTLDHALRLATQRCGLSLRAAVTALTWVPARALGMERELGRLAPGYAADAVLLSGDYAARAVWGAGRRLA